MKSGSGDDLLEDLEQDDEGTEETAAEDLTEKADTQDPLESTPDNDATSKTDDADVPYLLLRSGVKDRRDVVGIGLQQSTRGLENELLTELEDDIGVSNLPVMDLREAAYLIGLRHIDETKEVLLDWGYEHRG